MLEFEVEQQLWSVRGLSRMKEPFFIASQKTIKEHASLLQNCFHKQCTWCKHVKYVKCVTENTSLSIGYLKLVPLFILTIKFPSGLPASIFP